MRRIIVILNLFLVILFLGCQKEKSVKKEVIPIPVRVSKVKIDSITDFVSITGNSEAIYDITYSSKVMGKIVKLNVKEGDFVKKGDLLLFIDDSELLAKKAQSLNSIDLNKSLLKKISAALEEVEAQFENAKKNKIRYDKLFKTKSVREKDWEDVNTHYRVLLARKKELKVQLESIKIQIELAKNQLKEVNSLLKYTKIYADVDGIISKKMVNEGELVIPGKPLLTLTNTKYLKLKFRIADSDFYKVKLGDEIIFSTWGNPKKYVAKINKIIPKTYGKGYYYLAIAYYENKNYEIPVGAFLEGNIKIKEVKNAILVPRRTVLENAGKYYVFTIRNNKAFKRDVLMGIKNEDYIQIIKGLSKDDIIVIEGQNNLTNGQIVRIVK